MPIVAGVGTAVGQRPIMGSAPLGRTLEAAMRTGVQIALSRQVAVTDAAQIQAYLQAARIVALHARGIPVPGSVLGPASALLGADVRLIRRAVSAAGRGRRA